MTQRTGRATASAAVALGVLLTAGADGAEHAPRWRRITVDAAIDAMPSVFPDGRRVAFHSRRAAKEDERFPARHIWVIGVDGRSEERLSAGRAEEYQPAVAPDGQRIAFVSEARGSRDVWIMRADGSGAVPLTDEPGLEVTPAWSPDAQQIAYAALTTDGGSFDLWAMNADGSGRRRLTDGAADEIFPGWHPDGNRIAYVTNVGGQFDIHVLDVRGRRPPAPLVAGRHHETRPRFSPDGRKLLYTGWPQRAGTREARLWIANADGSAAQEVPAPPGTVAAAWLPDGLRLVAQTRDDDNWDLWLVPLPDTLTRPGRLQPEGPGAQRAELRDGTTLPGTVKDRTFRLRTAYAELQLPRSVVSEIRFDSAERGLARVVLANGDRVSGFLLEPEVRIAVADGIRRLPLGALSRLVVAGSAARSGPEQLVLRNGDSLSGRLRRREISLRVGGKLIALPLAELRSLECGSEGRPSRAVTRRGEIVEGALADRRWRMELAVGTLLDISVVDVARVVRLQSDR